MWHLLDVHAKEDTDTPDSHYCTTGCWPHGDEVRVFNASSQPFSVVHAPCEIRSMDGMSTTICRGSSGTIDAAPPAPWIHRMTACLEAVAACGTHVVGVIDAPSDLHIRAAIEGMTGLQWLFKGIASDDSKFLILTGTGCPQYLTVSDATGCTYTDKPWRQLVKRGEWDWTVETRDPTGLNRIETALARLLGTCEPCTQQRQVHLEFPEGVTVPACTAPYIKYGPGVDNTSVRFSSTRGITVHTTGRGQVTATVIAETAAGAEGNVPEDAGMPHIRTLLTSSDIGEIGAAYFTLGQLHLDEPMASIAATAMLTVARQHRPATLAPPPPVLRQASYNSAHTGWR